MTLGQWPLSLVTLGLVLMEVGQEYVEEMVQVECGVGHLQFVFELVSCCSSACEGILLKIYSNFLT